MKKADWIFAVGLSGVASASWQWLTAPSNWIAVALFAGLAVVWQIRRRWQQLKTIVELGGMRWDRHAFCQGWLITGATGAGKTRSGINQILHQLFRRAVQFGLLCIDDKGVLHETLLAAARHYGRGADTILLQVRPHGAGPDWKPTHRFNLTGDRSIPAAT